MSYYTLITHPVSSEKSMRLMQQENKLVFKVALHATKAAIKQAIEEHLKVNVMNVNTMITSRGQKKAYVTLSKDNPAIDVATQLGMM